MLLHIFILAGSVHLSICGKWIPKSKTRVCPEPPQIGTCALHCESDNDCSRDEKCCSNGCGTDCFVSCRPLECDLACDNGFKLDNNRCKICECKVSCALILCPDGHYCEDGECKTCPPLCEKLCLDGFKRDDRGCEICECTDPCEGNCKEGERCVAINSSFGCRAITKRGVCPKTQGLGDCQNECADDADCVRDLKCCFSRCGGDCQKPCPAPCKKECPYGLKLGDRGCYICECVNPCENVKCPPGQECVVVQILCINPPCPPPNGQCIDIVKPGLCPKPQGVGDCENACSADADCVKDLKCCPNGCGRDCQTTCPEPCKRECPYGLKVDDRGCYICECLDPCEIVKCPPRQECIVVQILCINKPCPPPKGQCVDIVKPGLCPKPQGVGDCENACSADADCVKDLKCCPNGCGRDCQTPCPEPCKRECPYGLKVDDRGCYICECLDPCESVDCPPGQQCIVEAIPCFNPPCPSVGRCTACSGVICLIFCEFGNVLDENGCPLCKCKPDPDPCRFDICPPFHQCVVVDGNAKCQIQICPVVDACFPDCKSGFRPDPDGCIRCACLDKCENFLCKINERCEVIDDAPTCVGCLTPVCEDNDPCEFGPARDENGCPTCDCFDPCEDIICKPDEQPVPIVEQCDAPPCPATCQCRLVPKDRKCPCGNPLLNKRGKEVTCRLRKKHRCSTCPPGYWCNAAPPQRYCVCCPDH